MKVFNLTKFEHSSRKYFSGPGEGINIFGLDNKGKLALKVMTDICLPLYLLGIYALFPH